MTEYRCYFTDGRGKFRAVKEFRGKDDASATQSAWSLLRAQKEFSDFELWEDGRLVTSTRVTQAHHA